MKYNTQTISKIINNCDMIKWEYFCNLCGDIFHYKNKLKISKTHNTYKYLKNCLREKRQLQRYFYTNYNISVSNYFISYGE